MRKHISLISLLALASGLLFAGVGCSGSGPDDGGIYFSFDQGENWEQRVFVRQEEKDQILIDAINTDSVVVDPTDENTLYLTSRENGVFKTVNHGENWFQTGLKEGRVRSLAIDPDDPEILYATYGISVLKSVDGGNEWDEILKDASGSQVTDVLVDSFDTRTIWATTANGTAYKTTDAGKNWQVNYRFEGGVRWIRTSDDDTRVLYASIAEEGLWTTTNKGRTWEFNEALGEIRRTDEIHFLEVDQDNKDVAYVFTEHGLLKTMDGGTSWDEIDTLLGTDSAENVAVTAFKVDHPNLLMFAVGNTLHKSVNGGKTWRTITTFPSERSIQDLEFGLETNTTVYAGVRTIEDEGGGFFIPTQ